MLGFEKCEQYIKLENGKIRGISRFLEEIEQRFEEKWYSSR